MRTLPVLAVALSLMASAALPSAAWADAATFDQNWGAARTACANNQPPVPATEQGQGNVGTDVTQALAFGCLEGKDAAAAPQKQIPGPPSGFSYNSQLYQDGFESGWYASWFRQGGTVPLPSDPQDFVQGWNAGFQAATAAQEAPHSSAGGGGGQGGSKSGSGGSGGSGGGNQPAPELDSIHPVSGPVAGGNTVRITGYYLSGATAVSFGGTAAASFQVVSNSEIDAVAPPGQAGTIALISVANASGPSPQAAQYTYEAGTFTAAFSASTASAGSKASVSGTAPAGATLSAYLFCSQCGGQDINGIFCDGMCSADTLGQATVDANGNYEFDFSVPSGAEPGAASVMVGCDTCSAGWVAADGLTIGGGASGGQGSSSGPPPDPGFAAGVQDGSMSADDQGACSPDPGNDQWWDYTLGYNSGCQGEMNDLNWMRNLTGSRGPHVYGNMKLVSPGAAATTEGYVRDVIDQQGVERTADDSGQTVDWTMYFTVPNGPPVTVSGSATLGGLDQFSNAFPVQVTVPKQALGDAYMEVDWAGVPFAWTAFIVDGPLSVTSMTPSHGSALGSTQVTLTGQGFDQVQSVTFGTWGSANFATESDSTILVTAPAGPPGTSVPVTVTSAFYQTVTVPQRYTYDSTLQPSRAPEGLSGSFTPSAPQGAGQQVTVAGSGPAGSTLSNALFCSGGCSGMPVGSTATDASGQFSVPFTLPSSLATNTLSPYALEIGCDTCGGWTGVNVVPASAAAAASAPPAVTGVSPPAGPDSGNQTVTVMGSNLGGATEVSFGQAGQGSSLQVASDGNSLTVVTPASSQDGPVDVQVTTPAGTSAATPADQYAYQPALPAGPSGGPASSSASPVPVVSGIRPGSGPDSGGQTVTITGSDLTGATGVSFGDFGQGTDIQVAPDGDSLQVVTPEDWWGDGPVDVQVTTPAGQSAVTSQTQYTYQPGQPPSGSSSAGGSGSQGSGTQGSGSQGSGTQGSGTQGGGANGPSPSSQSPSPPAPSGTPAVAGVDPPSGPDSGGQTVTITGSGLSGATAVNFGDFGQAQILQISPDGTSMQVSTPQAWWGDGPVYVQVTTPAGQSAVTSQTQYTYQPAPSSGSTSGSTSGSGAGSTSGSTSGSPPATGASPGSPTGMTPGGTPVDCSSPSLTPFDKQVDGCPGAGG